MTATTGAGSTVAQSRVGGWFLILLVLLMLAGLPLAVWLDLRALSVRVLNLQAEDLSSVISGIRGYYARNVVDRVLTAQGEQTRVIHDYADVPGAIPIPATLSLELGQVISEQQGNIVYRFVSDKPFTDRPSHDLDEFESAALNRLRLDPSTDVTEVR